MGLERSNIVNILTIALAAFGGGVLSAFLGWLDSKEPFDSHKFLKSVGFALLAGLGFAASYSFSDGITVRDVVVAILGGAGWDSLTNRFVGAVKS